MKSKMKIKMKIAGKLWGLSAILLFVSCAKGFDDNETFSGGVTNAQLESPVIDDNSFSTLPTHFDNVQTAAHFAGIFVRRHQPKRNSHRNARC